MLHLYMSYELSFPLVVDFTILLVKKLVLEISGVLVKLEKKSIDYLKHVKQIKIKCIIHK